MKRMDRTFLIHAAALLPAAGILLTAVGCGGGAAPVSSAPQNTAETVQRPGEAAQPETTAPESVAPMTELPENSQSCSLPLAQQLLTLCTGHTARREAALLEQAGFTVLAQNNFNKAAADPAHTCAYTVARRTVSVGGRERTLLLTAIRGTEAGEWYANVDMVPSRRDDAVFAENFLFAAQDVFLGLQPLIAAEEQPLLLVCGHSRGGACANLLGLLLNARFGAAGVYVYTFAAPATFRGDDPGAECSNIFNFVNPADLVTAVPPVQWGFRRLGTDILLPAAEDDIRRVTEAVQVMTDAAPTIRQYYTERHSLTAPGTAEDGITVYELTLAAVSSLAGTGAGDASAPAGDTLSALRQVTAESDFAPLFALLQQTMQNDGEGMAAVRREHIPSTYQTKLAIYAAEKEQ